jgi:hypothetical protein
MSLATYLLNALLEKVLEHLTLIIQKFRKGEEDREVWHTMIVYKGKYKTNNPSTWRVVCLKELHSKVINSIVSRII